MDVPLSAERTRSAMRLSVADGIAWAAMVGAAESFFVAQAVHLHASEREIGAVAAIPLLVGAIGGFQSIRLLTHYRRRRPIVVLGASLQAMTLAALAVMQAYRELTPWLLVSTLCLYQLGGQCAGAAWSSWFGDLVPKDERVRWFGRRTRLVHLSSFLSLWGAGFALQAIDARFGADLGFASILAFAALARVVSTILLARSPEPPMRAIATGRRLRRFLWTARGGDVRVLVLGGALFQAAVFVSSPFFTPFMLGQLGLGYQLFTLALAAQVAAKVVSMSAWGRFVDRAGARAALRLSMLLAAFVPLPWLFVSGFGGAVFAQVLSGFAWAGYEVATFHVLIASTRPSTRAQVVALQGFCNATGQVAGSQGGASVFAFGGFTAAFALGLGLRLAVALNVPGRIRRIEPGTVREPVLMRITGYRAGAGIAHRPMVLDDPRGAPPDRETPRS